MDEGGGDGHGDDPAVADEAEEVEENEYEELDGDVEDFYKSLNTNDAAVVKDVEVSDSKIDASEAVKAVAAEKEEDDDCEELYGDLDFGEGFLESLRRNDALVVKNAEGTATRIEASGAKCGMVSGSGEGWDYDATVFISDLHWWTTDAEVEGEVCKYGEVKEVRILLDKANGKSMGYCLVKFDDPDAAASCKEEMNGHVFNGRPCVVELGYRSYRHIKRMYAARMMKANQTSQAHADANLKQPVHGGDAALGQCGEASQGRVGLSGSQHGKRRREEKYHRNPKHWYDREGEREGQRRIARERDERRREHQRYDRDKCAADHHRRRYKSPPEDDDEEWKRGSSLTSGRHKGDRHSKSREAGYVRK